MYTLSAWMRSNEKQIIQVNCKTRLLRSPQILHGGISVIIIEILCALHGSCGEEMCLKSQQLGLYTELP